MTNHPTKHCPHCWKNIDKNSAYCNFCGEKQNLESSEKWDKTNVRKKIVTISIISLIVLLLGIVDTGLIIDYNTSQTTTNVNSATSSDTSSVVYITEHGEKYHKITCRYITESNGIQTTVNKATARGYTACSVCKPQ